MLAEAGHPKPQKNHSLSEGCYALFVIIDHPVIAPQYCIWQSGHI